MMKAKTPKNVCLLKRKIFKTKKLIYKSSSIEFNKKKQTLYFQHIKTAFYKY